MANKIAVSMEGVDALRRAVREMPMELKRMASDAVRQSTWNLADAMRRAVPSRTGTLLGSIEARVPIGTGLTGRVEISSEAYYWRFLEYGTKFMTARPFVRPAGEVEALAYEQRYQKIARELERLWTKK